MPPTPTLQESAGSRDVNPKQIFEAAAAAQAAGDLARAEALYDRLLAVSSGNPQVSYMLGGLRNAQGRHAEALILLETARAARPDFPPILLHMGDALQALRRFGEALAHYDAALKLRPDYPEALNDRANTLSELAREDEALAGFDGALRLRPTDPVFHYNRGRLLLRIGRHAEAVAGLERAIALQPDFAKALDSRANALMSLNRMAEARQDFDRAVALAPDDIDMRMNRAGLLLQTGGFAEAMADLDHVARLAPEHPPLLGQAAVAALYECDWARQAQLRPRLAAAIAAEKPGLNPWVLTAYGFDGAPLLRAARTMMRDTVDDKPGPLWTGERYDHSRIRVAYLSADFGVHPVGVQIVQLLERHDRARFEIIALSGSADDGSDIRARIRAACDQFHEMETATVSAIARKLRELEVDVVVDLHGYTFGNRFAALAWRAAPVQATWLGYPGTTGADFIDYVIGDRFVTPPEHQTFYSETIHPLPACFFPMDANRAIAAVPSRASEGLPESGLVFCCFNRNWKITSETFTVWMRLLQQTPGSVLWLRHYTSASEARLRGTAKAQGVDPARLVFAGKVGAETHLARHRLADLFLDTLPYGAHATAADALLAGLPVLTQLGGSYAGRVGASLLTACGLSELIARDAADYERLALELARDPARLRALREKLSANRATAPLFDMASMARDLETAYELMLAEKLG
jgi:predicted O-linked N-acetylglucosamine transferase (SPINDLY family)